MWEVYEGEALPGGIIHSLEKTTLIPLLPNTHLRRGRDLQADVKRYRFYRGGFASPKLQIQFLLEGQVASKMM